MRKTKCKEVIVERSDLRRVGGGLKEKKGGMNQ
jgi:hypothetical protein